MILTELIAEREAGLSALTDNGFAGMDSAFIASVKGHYTDFLRETARAAYLLGLEESGANTATETICEIIVTSDWEADPGEGINKLSKLAETILKNFEEKTALTKTEI